MSRRYKRLSRATGGFTLVEVILSMFVFTALIVPLLAMFLSTNWSGRAQQSLVASWLLEQEAASVRLYGDEGLTARRRSTGGDEWIIQVRSEGTSLVKHTLTAEKRGKKKGEVVVYGVKR